MSVKTTLFITAITLVLVAALSACLPFPTRADPGLVATAAAQTVSAQLTQVSIQTLVAELTKISQYTLTPPPTLIPTATLAPSATPLPPTATIILATNTPTKPPIPCAWAAFITDISVPDGTTFTRNASFTKTWRLQNAGSCTWNPDYALVFSSGSAMNGPASKKIGVTVRPGETLDLSVNLVAPDASGSYSGYWLLRTDSGATFGLGGDANEAFWVKINVQDSFVFKDGILNFATGYCSARWSSPSGNLNCPGSEDFGIGSVSFSTSPKLEGGYQENEATLIMIPSSGSNGSISGRYPPIKVGASDDFIAIIGCLNNSPSCDVTFKLNYSIDGGAVKNFATWTQTSDGNTQKILLDLNPLSGKTVEFILTVENNGSSKDDRAFWLMPRIHR